MIENFNKLSGYTLDNPLPIDEGETHLIYDPYHKERGAELVFDRFTKAKSLNPNNMIFYSLTVSYPLTRSDWGMFPYSDFVTSMRKLTNSPSVYCGVKNRDFFKYAFPVGGAKVFNFKPTKDYSELEMRFLCAALDCDELLTDEILRSQLYFRVKRINFNINVELKRLDGEISKDMIAEALFPIYDFHPENARIPFLNKSLRQTLIKNNRVHFMGKLNNLTKSIEK